MTMTMTTSDHASWAACQVCGHQNHGYRKHLNEVEVPQFIGECVRFLRELERSGSPVHPIIDRVDQLVAEEGGGRKAWAIWLLKLLEELEDAADAPDVAAEIENYLTGGFTS
jgi:hypothetical protein